MANSYPDQLGQWVRQKSPRRNVNLVAFLAIMEDVKTSLEAGYAVKAVWANMRECKRTDIGYEVFLHYVNRLIPSSRTVRPIARAGPRLSRHSGSAESNIAPDGTSATAAKAKKPSAPAEFVFNPAPKKEELL